MHEANAPLTKEARKPEQVNHNSALSCNKTFGDQALPVSVAMIFLAALYPNLNEKHGKRGTDSCQPKGQIDALHHQQRAERRTDGPPNVEHGVVD